MGKKIIGFVIKLVVTTGLFLLLFRPETYGFREDLFGDITPQSLWNELRGVELSTIIIWLGFATTVKVLGMLAGVLRWQLLLKGQGLKIPFWYMVQSWFVGRFIGIFLPGTIGLDGYRLYDSLLYTRQPEKCMTVIVVEKLIGLIALSFLVFITLPLGFQLLEFKLVFLLAMLGIMGSFVVVSFLLLLNPRVMQVLVAVVPVPAKIRNTVNRFGAALTAYSGHRGILVRAVVYGLMVHLGTCFMYFGTMMAIRTENASLWDILFASPIMITGTVVGPSVGGEGIREIVFATLLGSKTGVATAVLFSHLGWWVGEFVPFLIGAPIFFLRSRRNRDELESEIAAAREESAKALDRFHLTPVVIANYRTRLITLALGGIIAGLIAGGVIGWCEALWVRQHVPDLPDMTAFWWGPFFYGGAYACVGLGIAGAIAFLSLLVDRFLHHAVSFGLCLAGSLSAGCIIALFRFMRDVLEGHAPSLPQLVLVAGGCVAIGLAAGLAGGVFARVLASKRRLSVYAGVALFAAMIVGGAIFAALFGPPEKPIDFTPQGDAARPNVILVCADALRADYLKLYSPEAVAQTPNLEAFAKDAIQFRASFSNASWTKPSFATIFTGRYPSSHTATSKTARLPESVETLAEVFTKNGYFTKGLANNPNIAAFFGFDQGFHDYVDLKPNLHFGAGVSASRLTLYSILRAVRERVLARLSDKMIVTDAYQPAETVTREALAWLDGGQRPKDSPFFLFLHYFDTHDPFMDHDDPGVGYARVRMQHPDPDQFLEPMRKAYISEIEYMDQYLGEFFEALRQRGLYENSVILFTADHGEEFYDHEGWWHGQSLFDEVIHVPFLLKCPANTQAGAENADFARHVDIAPTLLHFAGVPRADGMQGQSLIEGAGNFTNAATAFTYSENDFENNIMSAVRTHERKLIHANEDNPRNHAPVEFYDLTKDPKELTNLAGQGDAKEGELGKVLADMEAFIEGSATEPELAGGMSQELTDQLEAVGYLDQ